jgi:hypothetical protein
MTYDRPGSQYDPRDEISSEQDQTRGSHRGSVQTQERAYQPPTTGHTPQKSKNRNLLWALLGVTAIAGILGGLLASQSHGPSVAAVHHAAATPTTPVHVIATFTGTGNSTSPAFKVTSSPVIARWGYSCAAAGKTTGAFAATVATTSGVNTQTIIRTSGSSGTSAATLHPSHVGGMYRLLVTATCPWRVILYSH